MELADILFYLEAELRSDPKKADFLEPQIAVIKQRLDVNDTYVPEHLKNLPVLQWLREQHGTP